MRNLLALFFISLGMLFGRTASAQPYPLGLSVVIIGPYSPHISDWQANPNRILVTVVNSGSIAYDYRFSGRAEFKEANVQIVTKDDVPVRKLTIQPGETQVLNGNDINIFDPNAATFTGADYMDYVRSGQLPEGGFELCLKAVNFDNVNQDLSDVNDPSRCKTVEIVYYDQPRSYTPTCEGTVEATSPQFVNFTWSQPTPPLSSVEYIFTMVEVEAGKDPYQAFLSRPDPPFFETRISNFSTYNYTPADPPLTRGTTYAWRVQAVDPTGGAVFKEDGYTPVCTFAFGTPDGTGGGGGGTPPGGGGGGGSLDVALESVYPVDNDTIPFVPPHLIVKFSPFMNDLDAMDYILRVEGGGQQFVTNRRIDFLGNVRTTQGWPDLPAFNEQAAHIVVNQEGAPGEAPRAASWSDQLKQGVLYTWSVEATFYKGALSAKQSTSEKHFILGSTAIDRFAAAEHECSGLRPIGADHVPMDQRKAIAAESTGDLADRCTAGV
jgi:hypothetical protein